MLKRPLKFILVLLLVLLCPANIFASEIENTAVPEPKTLITIGYLNAANHMIEETDNSISGVGYEFFSELEDYSNFTFEHISVTPETGFKMLESGEIDLLGPVPVSDEFILTNYLYTKEPIANPEIVLTAPLNSGIYLNDFEKFEQSVISVEDYGSFNAFNNLLQDFAAENNFSLDVIQTKNPGNMAWDTNISGYDIHVTELSQTNGTLEVVASLGHEPLHYIGLFENKHLLEEIDIATQKILDDDYNYINKLNLSYTDDSLLAKPSLSVSQRDLLLNKQTIDVFYNSNNQPFQWEDENGNAQGISIEIMNLIADDLNVDVNYLNENDVTNGEIYNNADISLALINNGSFSSNYISTAPYTTLPVSLIGEPQAHNEQYLYVASLQYHNVDLSNALNITGSYVIAYYNTVDSMIKALQDGRVNFVVSPSATNDYILSFDTGDDFFATQLDYELPLIILINKELGEEYRDIFNIAIQRLDTATTDGIIAESRLHYIPEDTLFEFIVDNIFIIIIFVLVIVCAFIFVVWRGNVRRQRDLLTLVNSDALTGLLSKYSFFEQARKVLENAKPGKYALYFVDIDNFKIVNETFGYNKGSEVIKLVALSIKQNLVESALIAREANDKFIFMTPLADENLSLEKAHKQNLLFKLSLREVLEDDFSIHISVGKYVIYEPSLDLDYMLDCANYARMTAKKGFGSTVVEYTKEMHDNRKLQNEIITGMETALFGDEFQVYYQPKIDLKTKRIVGAEALIRWIRDGKPVYFPDQFIPILENNRFIIRLDHFVTHSVCDFIRINHDLLSNLLISINLSGITLLQENLIDNLNSTVQNSKVSSSNLEFEVTESAFVENFDLVVNAITNLKKHGYTISMDDFGSGLSSYNRFKDIPLDILKLDKGFCSFTGSGKEEKATLIVESIISLAKQLELEVVAEGVETVEQAEILRKLGCDIAQGYLYARPMPKDKFIELLRNSDMHF